MKKSRFTDSQIIEAIGLCFLDLRNVRGCAWDHKRVYRLYRELELYLRIKPRKRAGSTDAWALDRADQREAGMVDGLHA